MGLEEQRGRVEPPPPGVEPKQRTMIGPYLLESPWSRETNGAVPVRGGVKEFEVAGKARIYGWLLPP